MLNARADWLVKLRISCTIIVLLMVASEMIDDVIGENAKKLTLEELLFNELKYNTIITQPINGVTFA